MVKQECLERDYRILCKFFHEMEVLKVWFVFACTSIAFLMGFNLIDWEMGLKIIRKIAEVFLAVTAEGKLTINFMNCSWFDK